MDDYRTSYATPAQIDSLWAVVGALRKEMEVVTGRLARVEAGNGASVAPGTASLESKVATGATA